MFHKGLFILAHQCGDFSFYSTYKNLVKNQWRSYEELKCDQDKQLRHMIRFACDYVPYYRRLFKELGLQPEDIQRVEDLERLPILTKGVINEHWDDFKPVNISSIRYYDRATGGSTGTPFRYRLEKFDRFLGGAMLYRGWGYAGYELSDRMVFLAGASLGVGTRPDIIKKVHEIARNIKMLSSFDMGEEEMRSYVDIINRFKPKYLRGYASSIYFFSKYVEEGNILIHKPSAVFTTAEKLYPHMRDKIESVFGCEVYDAYGLNDGGVSAYECPEHSGLHIDTERSVMEVVDENGHQLEDGEGRILATSLYNYAMPFIRYDTGDIGRIIPDTCGCGRGYRLLKEIMGRSVDILVTPEGKNVHGWFFLYIFWEYCKGIKEYQVVQEKIDKIVIKIVPEENFDEKQIDKIKEEVRNKSEGWNVEFKFVDKIERTGAGKYKFIINTLESK